MRVCMCIEHFISVYFNRNISDHYFYTIQIHYKYKVIL